MHYAQVSVYVKFVNYVRLDVYNKCKTLTLKPPKNHFAFLILICSFCQDFVTLKKRLVGRCRKIGDHH
jgi:hypothetical protein